MFADVLTAIAVLAVFVVVLMALFSLCDWFVDRRIEDLVSRGLDDEFRDADREGW